MRHRTGVLGTRALVESDAACVAALEGHPDFDPEGFADFVRANNLREWFTPLLDDPRARGLLTPELAADLAERRAGQPALKRALLGFSEGIRGLYESAGIPVLFLKGLYLAERFYGDLHRRHQYDVDVMVPREDFIRAIEALAALGCDVGEQARYRIWRARVGAARKFPQTATLKRADGLEIDLHCRLKSRQFPGIDERSVWSERVPFSVGGIRFETLSDDHTLMFLLVSIADDIRHGKCRAKQFLDLYRILGATGPALDWDAFFARREREGLVKTCVNVFAIFLALWDCGAEMPGLVAALAERRRLIEIAGAEEAEVLMERARRSPRHLLWFKRLAPGSKVAYRAWALSGDLPHTLARLRGPRFTLPSASGLSPSPSPDLPGPIATLLAREGLVAARVEPITALPATISPRSTYRITLADGTAVKGRIVTEMLTAGRVVKEGVVTDATRARKMARWIPVLPKGRFPTLLATEGAATLETWLEGRPPSGADAALFADAGALLGEVHGVVPPERLAADDARVRAWWSNVERWIAELRRGGLLVGELADRTIACLQDRPPPGATWGLRHGDFSLDNLIVSDAGLCCVDNATVAPGLLETDLAQTFYRWPMSSDDRDLFLRGYRCHGIETTFLSHEPFWMTASALHSAAFRQRSGTGALEEPLRALAAHV